MLVGIGVIVALPVSFLLGVIQIACAPDKQKRIARVKSFGVIGCALVCALGLSLIIGKAIYARKVSAAQSYVERVAPLLDEIKNREGRYPPQLPVAVTGPTPVILSYASNGTTFRFIYQDPPGYFCGHTFTSDVRRWIYTD